MVRNCGCAGSGCRRAISHVAQYTTHLLPLTAVVAPQEEDDTVARAAARTGSAILNKVAACPLYQCRSSHE